MTKPKSEISLRERAKRDFPGAVLDEVIFHGGVELVLTVELGVLRSAAAMLVADPNWRLSSPENFSVHQKGRTLVFSYFIMSPAGEITACLKTKVPLPSDVREVDAPSLVKEWPMIATFEAEAGELFGIRFLNEKGESVYKAGGRLPEDWYGYPLRKAYVFPMEFLGISHVRTKES